MTRFRTRPMQPGDAPAFNQAYNSLGTAPYRPLEEMQRIWRGGPAGPVRSVIIEANEGRDWRLVGHHGLCPVRFTLGLQDLVFAKTVNCFLLPEFRTRFVYLRFQQRCLEEVEQEFDATYTLTGEAVRRRAALGYDTSIPELDFEQGLRAPAILSRFMMRLVWRFPTAMKISRPWRALPRRRSALRLIELSSGAARGAEFFATFWNEARLEAGLAPRRDATDLAWRFWDEPGNERTTLTYIWPDGIRGYGIVNSDDGLHFTLEDIFLSRPRADLLRMLLDAVLGWCAEQGGLMFSFMTTPDSQPPDMLSVYRLQMGTNLSKLHRGQRVSRRMTALGRARIGAAWPPCNITAVTAIT